MEKDHLEIILEDIREKFELVLEGHEVLHKEIQNTRQELREEIGFVNVKVEALSQKVDAVDKKVDAVDKKVDAVDKKVDAVEKRLAEKIDAVAADLAAHRADTEGHGKGYRVSES
ncbi:MAG: hypothetical protein C0392_08175 [Syntrophus sp. (in: bacteria)]|nr:hypothetical protein [Syntrophus sp. (in: bacteria)]